jgi:hypothetical protein
MQKQDQESLSRFCNMHTNAVGFNEPMGNIFHLFHPHLNPTIGGFYADPCGLNCKGASRYHVPMHIVHVEIA